MGGEPKGDIIMENTNRVKPEQLRKACNESIFDFSDTSSVPEAEDVIGQDRAVEAVEFGMGVDGSGYNIYALGPVGVGRTYTIKRFVEARAREKPVPDDWCYVHNFADPQRPKYLRFAPGKGKAFRADMENLVSELKNAIRQALRKEKFELERNALMQKVQTEQTEMFSELEKRVKEAGFSLQRSHAGFNILPVRDGKPFSSEDFGELPEKERHRIEERAEGLQQDLQRTLHAVRELETKGANRIRDMERNTVLFSIEYHINALRNKYDIPAVSAYLDALKEDVVSNPGNILASSDDSEQKPPGPAAMMQAFSADRYKVNLIVDNSETPGAPVVIETNPTLQNLIGKVERQAHFGMLTTNFNLIKSGALHRANGGFLILEAEYLLRNMPAYMALKRAFKDGNIRIYDLSEIVGAISTTALEPEPVPLDVKVIVIGNPQIYYLLYGMDEEFHEFFKVKAEFNLFMDRTGENERLYARFLASRCREDGLCNFDKSGVARVVEYGSELAGDQTKLSTRFSDIFDLAREAAYWSRKNGNGLIRREHVQQAIDAKIRRSNRVEELIKQLIERGDIFIDTDGEAVGQVNGLSIISLGDYLFGRPSRITARTYIGRGGVVNIEREVKMSGPIHNKGVMILSGYLNGKYGRKTPLSLSASIGFEQLYEGVEGDSASSAELYALLSSLSGFPLRQDIAVTGSVNQRGDIQPIGGVTQKIEGFFDVCKAKGLTGRQGVIIPKTNIKNLMLRDEVVQAAAEGTFSIFAVATIDEGIEILTGKDVGALRDDGTYPEGTVNYAVEQRLREFTEEWSRQLGSGAVEMRKAA
jgi:lon-related putative ATP-dependent protease